MTEAGNTADANSVLLDDGSAYTLDGTWFGPYYSELVATDPPLINPEPLEITPLKAGS